MKREYWKKCQVISTRYLISWNFIYSHYFLKINDHNGYWNILGGCDSESPHVGKKLFDKISKTSLASLYAANIKQLLKNHHYCQSTGIVSSRTPQTILLKIMLIIRKSIFLKNWWNISCTAKICHSGQNIEKLRCLH